MFRHVLSFDCQRDGIAAAEAQRRNASLRIAPSHFVKQRHENARAARADRMAQSDRAAIDVDFFRIQFELLHDGDRLDGKCLVQFDEIDIGEIPADLCRPVSERLSQAPS